MFSASTWVAIVAAIIVVFAITDSYCLRREARERERILQAMLEAILDDARALKQLLKTSLDEVRQLRRAGR